MKELLNRLQKGEPLGSVEVSVSIDTKSAALLAAALLAVGILLIVINKFL